MHLATLALNDINHIGGIEINAMTNVDDLAVTAWGDGGRLPRKIISDPRAAMARNAIPINHGLVYAR